MVMALLTLFNPDTIHCLVERPEELDMQQLLQLSRGFFSLQAAIGLLSFLYGAYHSSMGLSTVGNLAIPVLGIYSARDDSPENYKTLRICSLYWVLGAIYSFLEALLGLSLRGLVLGSLKAVVYGLQWLVLARLWRWMQHRYVATVQFYLLRGSKMMSEALFEGTLSSRTRRRPW